MTKTVIYFIFLFIILTLAQTVVFNNICLFNVASPIIFIYFILRLPVTLSTNWVLTLSFLLGLSVDIFSDTQGMNALACTILAMLRRPILRLFFAREDDLPNPELSVKSLGIATYAKYLFTSTLIYLTLIFMIDAFTFFNPLQLFLRITTSCILTFILILGIDYLATHHRREKRL